MLVVLDRVLDLVPGECRASLDVALKRVSVKMLRVVILGLGDEVNKSFRL